jgi:hypothetical protein
VTGHWDETSEAFNIKSGQAVRHKTVNMEINIKNGVRELDVSWSTLKFFFFLIRKTLQPA